MNCENRFNHIEGFAGILYDAHNAFDQDFIPFIKSVLPYQACFRGDDFVISHYFQKKRKKIETMSFEYPTRIPLHVHDYGLQADALHIEDGTCVIEHRFAECKEILERLNLS